MSQLVTTEIPTGEISENLDDSINTELAIFTKAYIKCAYQVENLVNYKMSVLAFDKMADDCKMFFNVNSNLLDKLSAKQAGHDFWLTRNGHNEGFWSRGYGKLGESLTACSEQCGACDLYISGNLIHVA